LFGSSDRTTRDRLGMVTHTARNAPTRKEFKAPTPQQLDVAGRAGGDGRVRWSLGEFTVLDGGGQPTPAVRPSLRLVIPARPTTLVLHELALANPDGIKPADGLRVLAEHGFTFNRHGTALRTALARAGLVSTGRGRYSRWVQS
jgi:hypothetical protein